MSARITGRTASGDTDFIAEVPAEHQPHWYRPERTYEPGERLELRIAINFRREHWIEAAAQIAGFRGVRVRLLSSRTLEADIEHAGRNMPWFFWPRPREQNCHLVCFENGETSRGPCLICPDGEYQIRICC